MSDNGRLITFELDEEGEAIEIHGDERGLRYLRDLLSEILTKGRREHYHLMTQDWGGQELSGELQNQNCKLVHHVIVFLWPISDEGNT